MPTLEPSHSQFVLAGHANAVRCGNCRGSIGTAASYFVHCILTGFRVRQTHYDYPMMKQCNVKTDSCLLTASSPLIVTRLTECSNWYAEKGDCQQSVSNHRWPEHPPYIAVITEKSFIGRVFHQFAQYSHPRYAPAGKK